MLKFAFIFNMPGESPASCSGTYDNSESSSLIAGTDGMEQTAQLVKKLTGEGYTLFNLCGDFDDEMTAELKKAAGGDVKIVHADYLPAELEKVSKVEELTNYGIIIKMDGVENIEKVDVTCPECATTALFVKDEKQAAEAAAMLADQGALVIELCSWFDRKKTEAIIKAIGGRVPVGTCGEL